MALQWVNYAKTTSILDHSKPNCTNPTQLNQCQGEYRLINLVSALLDDHVQLTNNPGLGNGVGGTCDFDSGGPILKDDLIVAVNSFGVAANCKGNDFAYRMDVENAQDFLSEYVTLP